jgi:hypothetical protein
MLTNTHCHVFSRETDQTGQKPGKTHATQSKGKTGAEPGDALNALLSAASMNFQKLLAVFLRFILRLVFGFAARFLTLSPSLLA